jgi:hypothetical protein
MQGDMKSAMYGSSIIGIVDTYDGAIGKTYVAAFITNWWA